MNAKIVFVATIVATSILAVDRSPVLGQGFRSSGLGTREFGQRTRIYRYPSSRSPGYLNRRYDSQIQNYSPLRSYSFNNEIYRGYSSPRIYSDRGSYRSPRLYPFGTSYYDPRFYSYGRNYGGYRYGNRPRGGTRFLPR